MAPSSCPSHVTQLPPGAHHPEAEHHRILFVREEEGEEEGVYLQLETRERVRFLAKERELCDVMAIKNVMVRGTPEGCGGQF